MQPLCSCSEAETELSLANLRQGEAHGRSWKRLCFSVKRAGRNWKELSLNRKGFFFFVAALSAALAYLLFMQIGSLLLYKEWEDFTFRHPHHAGDRFSTFVVEPLLGASASLLTICLGLLGGYALACIKEEEAELYQRIRVP